MRRENDLIKNTIVLSLGKYFPKLLALITLPIITSQLTKIEYGTYDLINTLISLILPIVTLQIQSAAFRFLIDLRSSKEGQCRIISNIFYFTISTSLLAITVIFIAYKNIQVTTKILICLYFLSDIMLIALGQIARGLTYNGKYAFSAIISSIVNSILIVFFVFLGEYGINGVFLSLGVANCCAVIFLFFSISLHKYLSIKNVSRKILIEMLAYSWPMIPNNLSNWVLKISDRLIISAILGVEANAVYAIANKIPNLLAEAQGVFTMAWQENASIIVDDKDAGQYYNKIFDFMFSIIVSMTFLLIAVTPMLFTLLIKGDYDEAYYQMPILFIGSLFYCLASFQGGIYIAHKRTKEVGITTIAAAGCNLVIHLLLINVIGITAGSISTLVSYLLLFVFRMCDVHKFQKIKYNYRRLIMGSVILVIMCLLTYQRNYVAYCFNTIIACVGTYLYNKDLIIKLIHKFIIKNNKYRI